MMILLNQLLHVTNDTIFFQIYYTGNWNNYTGNWNNKSNFTLENISFLKITFIGYC